MVPYLASFLIEKKEFLKVLSPPFWLCQLEFIELKGCLNKVGHTPVCKQSKRGWMTSIFYSFIVTSPLYDDVIMLT